MPEFDKNAAYIWAMVVLAVIVPALLGLFAFVRAHHSKSRLERLRAQEDET